MRLIQYLQEARRNPKQNPKYSIVDALEPYKDKPNHFIHYTYMEKLGIYPKTEHNTPQGIYAYPLKEIWKNLVNNSIPYQGEAPNVFLFKYIGNKAIVTDKYDFNDFDKDLDKLKVIYIDKLKDMNIDWETFVKTWKDLAYLPLRAASVFMSITLRLSQTLRMTSHINLWNKIIRQAGHDAIIDSAGYGVIHTNEPTQAVFFDITKIKVIRMIHNRVQKNHPTLIKISNVDDFLNISKTYDFYSSDVSLLFRYGQFMFIKDRIVLNKNKFFKDLNDSSPNKQKKFFDFLMKDDKNAIVPVTNNLETILSYISLDDDLLEYIYVKYISRYGGSGGFPRFIREKIGLQFKDKKRFKKLEKKLETS